MPEPTLHVFDDLHALAHAAAARTVALIRDLPANRPVSLALSGGSTPRPFHEALAGAFRDAVPWSRVHLFWGDERFVPPDDPDSNLAMARETLIRHVPVPPSNVHPIPTATASPEASALAYETTLQAYFADVSGAGFDVLILGMGDDGHTASLFPDAQALHEVERWAVPVDAPAHAAPRARITLTLPLINQSRHVLFLVAGAAKHDALHAILDTPVAAEARLPAARVTARASLAWYADRAAAGRSERGPTES
jgi:6-phosphogluconolactonase